MERPLDRAAGTTLVALALTLILAPLTAGVPLTDDPLVIYRVAVVPSDLPLAVLIALVAWRAIRSPRRPQAGTLFFAVAVLVLGLRELLDVTPIGAQTMFRMIGALAIALAVSDLSTVGERTLVFSIVAIAALAESAITLLQIFTGAPIGMVGEAPNPLSYKGPSVHPRGTFLHPYFLAGFALVAASTLAWMAIRSRRRGWTWGVALAAIPIGVTYSRTALIGLGGGIVALAWAAISRPAHRAVLIALVLGAAIPAVIWNGGWVARVEDPDTSASYRSLLQEQALQLTLEHPLLGVGPGRYVEAARLRFPDSPRPIQPVHSIPLIVAAEAGIPAAVVFVVMLIAVGWRATRSGPAALAAFVMFLPYVLVDVYPYLGAQGPAIFGLWIGSLGLFDRQWPQAGHERSSSGDLAQERPR